MTTAENYTMYIRGYIVYFNDIITVLPYLWSLSLPLVVRVGVQHGGGLPHWLHSEECLATDEKINMIALNTLLSECSALWVNGNKTHLASSMYNAWAPRTHKTLYIGDSQLTYRAHCTRPIIDTLHTGPPLVSISAPELSSEATLTISP